MVVRDKSQSQHTHTAGEYYQKHTPTEITAYKQLFYPEKVFKVFATRYTRDKAP